jgi:hypothetical protein
MLKLWTGHEIYPVTVYVNIWPPSLTLTLEVGDRLLRMTHLLIIVSNCGKYLQNSFKDKKLWTGHDIYPKIDNVDLNWASATLTLEVGVWLLRMTHRLMITNICAKIFQIHLINDKVMDLTGKWDRWTDRRMEPISISPIFLRKRRGTKIMYQCNHLAGLQFIRVF